MVFEILFVMVKLRPKKRLAQAFLLRSEMGSSASKANKHAILLPLFVFWIDVCRKLWYDKNTS